MKPAVPHMAAAASLLATVLAGCVVPEELAAENTNGLTGGTVVAVIETSLFAYHAAFAVSDERDVDLERFGQEIGARTLHVTYDGTMEDNLRRDASLWAETRDHELYRVAGTNLFLYATARDPWILGGSTPRDGLDVRDSHAAAVASQLRASHNDTIVVIVEANTAPQGEAPGFSPSHLVYPESFVEAFGWVREQPWIDVLSVSVANYFNPPDSPLAQEVNEIAVHTREMVAHGKMVVFGAGNFGGPPTFTGTHGPPWAVSVGAVNDRDGDNPVFAAKLPDFVQNMNVLGPDPDSMDGYEQRSGTSVAAPAVAGRFAAAITELRQAAGLGLTATGRGAFVPAGAFGPDSPAIGPWEIRSAFNVTAAYWSPGEPRFPSVNDTLVTDVFNVGVPIPPGAESTVMGWGYVGDPETDAAVALLLDYARSGDRSVLANPPTKGVNQAVMENVFTARQAWFDAVLPPS